MAKLRQRKTYQKKPKYKNSRNRNTDRFTSISSWTNIESEEVKKGDGRDVILGNMDRQIDKEVEAERFVKECEQNRRVSV